MSTIIEITQIPPDLAHDIDAELARARQKFPQPNANFTALVEEVGELARALMENDGAAVRAEGIQVAAMAIRVITEGDPLLFPTYSALNTEGETP